MSEVKAEYFRQVKRTAKAFVEIVSTDDWDGIKKAWTDLIYTLSFPPCPLDRGDEVRLRADEMRGELRSLWSNRLDALSLEKEISRQIKLVEDYSNSL